MSGRRMDGVVRRIGTGMLLFVGLALVASASSAEQAAPACEPGLETPVVEVDRSAEAAARARALRAEARSVAPPDRAALLARIDAFGESLVADADVAGRARLLLHVHHTRRLLSEGEEGADLSEAWLAQAEAAARGPSDGPLRAHIALERAALREARGDDDAALALARESARRAAATDHRTTLYRAQSTIARLLARRGDEPAALAAYRVAVDGLERTKADVVARSRDDASIFAREVEPTYRGLVDLLLRAAAREEDPSAPVVQSLLAEARDVVEAGRQAELRDYYRDACLANDRTSLPEDVPGTVVVYPIALDDRVEIIVARDGRLSRHAAGIDGATLSKLARDFRLHLESRLTNRYRRPAEALFEALIRPIEPRLEEGKVETLLFVPGPALRQVPMAALYDGERDRFLIEDHPVAITPSLRMTRPRRSDAEAVQLLLGALTESVQGFPALPHVATELEVLGTLVEGKPFVNDGFRAAPFSAALRDAPFDWLHVASHGQFTGNPDESFLLTWDGRVRIDELGAFVGQARFRAERPLEMLVLSACETAVGDERAALGLAGAAIRMGARSVVASLWRVNDRASSQLMTAYYEALVEDRASRAEALRRAQRSLIAESATRHPNLWSAFVLIGSWL